MVYFIACGLSLSTLVFSNKSTGACSSAVEHSAFNRLVESSNLSRRTILTPYFYNYSARHAERSEASRLLKKSLIIGIYNFS
jgi:hypothetical protein